MRIAIVVAAAIALAGCAEKQLNELNYTEFRGVVAKMRANCAAAGLKDGSPEWAVCIRQETMAEDARRKNDRIRRNDAADALAGAGQAFNNGYNNALVNRPHSCTTNLVGRTAFTNCY